VSKKHLVKRRMLSEMTSVTSAATTKRLRTTAPMLRVM
jgi:hypothetical protein